MATNDPVMIKLIKKAQHKDRVTISHWPRLMTGLKTGVQGTAKAGTDITFLNLERAFFSGSSERHEEEDKTGKDVPKLLLGLWVILS